MMGSKASRALGVGLWALGFGCCGFTLLTPAFAQTPAEKPAEKPAEAAKAPEPLTAIVGGDIWTVTKGVIKSGTLIIKGSKIDKVGGPELKAPEGAKVIDATGRVVAPGFIVPAGGGGGGFGGGGGGGGLIRGGGGRIKDSLDPYAMPLSLALATGITSSYVVGGGAGGFGGFGGGDDGGGGGGAAGGLQVNNAVIKMSEGDMTSMLMKEPSTTTFATGGGGFGGRRGGGGLGRFAQAGGGSTKLSARYNLRDQLRRAKEYQDKLAQNEKDKAAGKKVTNPVKPAGIDEAIALVKREHTLRITASEVSDIRWALSLVDDFGVKMVISPATEAWIIADEIAKRNVMLIITARSREPSDERNAHPTGSNPDAPGILQKAGVKFALITPTPSFSTGGELGRDLLTYPLEADFAVRGGADDKTALEAMTITAAEILGIADKVGSIEPGKDADIVIFTGDPLDYRSFAEKTFVNGKLLYEMDKSSYFGYVKQLRSDLRATR